MWLLQGGAILAADRPITTSRSPDPGDEYLVGLAEAERAVLVSGHRHLLGLAGQLPICDAAHFLEMVGHSGDPAV